MHIGLDARLLHNATGIGRYTRSLFFEFARRKSQTDCYTLFTDQAETAPVGLSETNSWPPEFQTAVIPCATRILWTNLYLPGALRQHQIDLYHGLCNFELPLRKTCRYVVTIHDLVPLFFPHAVPWKHRLFFNLFMKRVAHTADRIITDSEHSRRDIIRYLGVSEQKIRVIYLGYTPQFGDYEHPVSQHDVLARYGITHPYLLFVGVIEPKKNLERAVEAFALLRQMSGIEPNIQLVMAGGNGWGVERLTRTIQACGVEHAVRLTGYVPEHDLPYLYAGAEVFVFPSIYEGFGLPVLEAMTYGAPVVTSTASSLPEIVGEAGILVAPDRPEAIAEGIAAVLRSPEQQARMRQASRRQAQRFSWKRTADETYQVYDELRSV